MQASRTFARRGLRLSCVLALTLSVSACGKDEAPKDGAVDMGDDSDGSTPESDAGSSASDAGNGDGAANGDGGSATPQSDAGTPPPPKCKRGLGYGYHSKADMMALRRGVHWWYNWSPTPDTKVATSYKDLGVEFVPMAWDEKFTVAGLEKDIPQGAKTLLGFNEPNFFGQANLSASDAAKLWPDLEKVAKARGLALASPAVNFCGPAEKCFETDPFKYLDAFFAACKNCKIDYVAAHWYACDGPALTWYLGQLKKYKKPIWLTEFSCLDGDRSVANQKKYMTDALKILEADTQVAAYAWFIGRSDDVPSIDLLGADGKLTELGELYVSLPHHDPSCAR
ncbi:MAG: glycoside hydrolase family protein [Myxococcales bacterium]